MSDRPTLRAALRRGALLTAANWPVIIVQFVVESLFKILLAVPVLGGAFLVAVLVGGDVVELITADLRDALAAIAGALIAQPIALASFLLAFLLVLFGGSAVMFFVKAGTVSVLVAGDRAAGPIERPPLRLESLRRANAFSIERFMAGCARFFGRYLILGYCLIAVYGLSGGAYLLALFAGYRVSGQSWFLGWPLVAALCSSALVVWITVVNFLYLLVQIVVAEDNVGIRSAVGRVARFLRADGREAAGVFAVVLVIVVMATAMSLLASTGLGLIAFVPLAGLIVLPLQAAAWLLRGLLFQYLGLTALGAYLKLYRAFASAPDRALGPTPLSDRSPTVSRTA